MTGFVARNLRLINKSTLIGTVDLGVPAWRVKFKGCLWHRKDGKEWLNFPSGEWIKNGQRNFADLVEFTDRNVRDRFQQDPLEAVHAISKGMVVLQDAALIGANTVRSGIHHD
jgi:hypothetical protein